MKNEAAAALASLRWEKLTKEERSAIGRNAIMARWKGHKKAEKTVKIKRAEKSV